MAKFFLDKWKIAFIFALYLNQKDMKNATQYFKGIEILVLAATFNGNTTNAKADLYQEPNKSYYTAVAAGTCAPVQSEVVGSTIINPTTEEKVVLIEEGAQENTYIMLDDCGRTIGYVYASNIKDASRKAIESKTPRLWKVKRCYNGGIRG